MFTSPYCRDHGERPIGGGGRPTDIRERTDDSSERRHAIVLGLAPRSTAKKKATSSEQREYPQADRGGREDNLPSDGSMVKDPDNGQRTMRTDAERQKAEAKRRCNICGGLFKNERGVKIHQGKSKCKGQDQQRRAPKLSQSNLSGFVKGVCQSVEEDQGQEANHSAPDLPAQPTQSTGRVGEPRSPEDFERKPRLNLPSAADRRWAQLDDDLNTILENTLKGDAARRSRPWLKLCIRCATTPLVRKKERLEGHQQGQAGDSGRSKSCEKN